VDLGAKLGAEFGAIDPDAEPVLQVGPFFLSLFLPFLFLSSFLLSRSTPPAAMPLAPVPAALRRPAGAVPRSRRPPRRGHRALPILRRWTSPARRVRAPRPRPGRAAPAEMLMQVLLVASAVAAFLVGYVRADFQLMLLVYAGGVVLTALVTVPNWPFFNRNPLKWLDAAEAERHPRPQVSAGAAAGGKKKYGKNK